MSTTHFNLNRPVHLARRDAFYEAAVTMMNTPVQALDTLARLNHIEQAQFLLRTSRRHADFAGRSVDATPAEHDFLHFLDLLAHNVQAIHSMLQHQSHLEAEESFLRQFLGANAQDSALPAMHYRRRAEDILQGLRGMLRLADKPYQQLKLSVNSSLSEENLVRYRKAWESFDQEIAARLRPPTPVPAP